jgi:hypothetical protein
MRVQKNRPNLREVRSLVANSGVKIAQDEYRGVELVPDARDESRASDTLCVHQLQRSRRNP